MTASFSHTTTNLPSASAVGVTNNQPKETAMYAIRYTDSQVESEVFLSTDPNDPLDWDAPMATFTNEADAINYSVNAYDVLISYITDWKSVSCEVVEVFATNNQSTEESK